MEKYKNKTITDKEVMAYVHHSYDLFFDTLVDFITADTNKHGFLLKDLNNEWKITFGNLKSTELFAVLGWKKFLNLIMLEIQSRQKDDYTFHYLVEGLFPEIHSKTWEIILLFISSCSNVKSVIEDRLDIWYVIELMSTVASTSSYTCMPGQNEEEIVRQKERKRAEKIDKSKRKTYELTLYLFQNDFSQELLAQYIKKANNLKYLIDSQEEANRKALLSIFTGLKEYRHESND
jgi:hypothetical protein